MTKQRQLLRPVRHLTAGAVVAVLATAMAVCVTPAADAVPAPPPNPSDQEIQASAQQASAAAARVGEISGEVSTTQAKIRQLRDAMELKAELAMKARVDVQMAEMHADDARARAQEAAADVADAKSAVDDARHHAADFAAASFRHGTSPDTLMALMDAESISDLAARQAMIDQVSASQQGVLDALRSARTGRSNKAAEAEQAAAQADQAAAEAEQAHTTAVEAKNTAEQSFEQGGRQLDALQAKLQEQSDTYQQALNEVATLKGQRDQYQAWLAAKKEEQKRVAAQAASWQEHASQLQKELEAFENSQHQEAKNRAVALKKEKERQAKLKAEQEKLKEEGKDPDQATLGNRGEQVVQAALKYLGTPYAWGGGTAKGPSKGIHDGGVADRYGDYKKIGFDCSGLALYAWAQVGVYLPHYSAYQYNYGTHVSRNNLQPGDLVFYAYNTANPSTIHHVAIYMGDGKMIQAPQSGEVVKISPMRWRGYIGAARPGS